MARHTYILVRGYGKTAEDFIAFSSRFSILDAALRAAHIPYTILYTTPDTTNTPSELPFPTTIVRVGSDPKAFSWSIGLNIPITHILQDDTDAYIIPFSFEVELDKENSDRIAQTLAEGKRFIACRKNPSWLYRNPLTTLEEVRAVWQQFYETIQQKKIASLVEDTPFLEKLCQFGRNTLAHYAGSDFQTYGLFTDSMDTMGGMEDWEFLLRVMKDQKDAHFFDSVILYRDIRIQDHEENQDVIATQISKRDREVKTMKYIFTQAA